MGTDSARRRTLWGSSALEMGYHRLLEDGSERGGALGSDLVDAETADEGRSGDGERVASVSMGSDRKAKARPKAHLSEVTELPLSPSHSLVMPSVVYSPLPPSSRPQSWLPSKL
jgi:hypothetical protein